MKETANNRVIPFFICTQKICTFFIASILALGFLLLNTSHAYGQLYVSSHISPHDMADDNDSIITPAYYFGIFDTSGYSVFDSIGNFTYYTIDGDSINLKETLITTGKPVLLISGSYTCPQFREKSDLIQRIYDDYDSVITVIVVYVYEPHPDVDFSPYTGTVYPHPQNIFEGMHYRQPKTYGERKAIVQDMLNDTVLNISYPVYLDDTSNSFWNHYGPAANNAYFLHPNGRILHKHAYFDQFPNSIMCELRDHLSIVTDECLEREVGGEIQWIPISSDTIFGEVSTTLYFEGYIWNNSDSTLLCRIQKNDLSALDGWESSICLDVCYPPSYSNFMTAIAAHDSLLMHVYLYSPATPGFGTTEIVLINDSFPEQSTLLRVYGSTLDDEVVSYFSQESNRFHIFPNPVQNQLYISGLAADAWIRIKDINGKLSLETRYGWGVSTELLTSGLYFLEISNDESFECQKLQIAR